MAEETRTDPPRMVRRPDNAPESPRIPYPLRRFAPFASVSTPLFVKDVQGRYVYANTAYAALVERRPEELPGRTDDELFTGARAAARRAAHEESLADGESACREEDYADVTGLRRHVTLKHRLFTDADGTRYVVGTLYDNTARRAAEDELKRTLRELDVLRQLRAYDAERLRRLEAELTAERHDRERYAAAVESLGSGVWELDLRDDSVRYSPRWKRLLGYSEDEIPATLEEWTRRIHPDDHAGVILALRAALEGRAPGFERTFRMRCRDGAYRRFLARGAVLANEEHKPQRLMGSLVDVTAQKELEERVASLSERVERSDRELEEFAYTASRDLGEPLRRMLTFGDRLRESSAPLDERERDFLQRMQETGRRMQSLVENLLIFSKTAATEPVTAETDLDEVLREALADLSVRVAECRAVVETPASLGRARVERAQAKRLFQNLVSNALKFSKLDVPPLIRIEARGLPENFIEVTVTDNGLGFDERQADRIFKPFQRLHPQAEGSGMGLATCRKIVERHGGHIFAHSTPGLGSRFIFTLPSAVSTSPQASS